MKIGESVYVHGYVDEIRKDTVIIRNEGGYFGTAENEVAISKELHNRLINWAYDKVLDVISSVRSEHNDKSYRNACDEIAHVIAAFLKANGGEQK